MKPVEILREARKLIEKPENWIQGKFHDGAAFCMDGACMQASGCGTDTYALSPDYWTAFHLLREVCGSVIRFNDAVRRTHPEVLAAFDRAIALAEQSGAST